MNNSRLEALLPDINSIYNWYILNNKPNRDRIRQDDSLVLPTNCSKQLLESLLPIFNNLKDKPLVYIPNEEEKEEITMVIASDFHIPFYDEQALRVFFNFLKEYQPDELVLNGNINDCYSFSTHPKQRDLANVFRTGKDELKYWFPIAELLRDILPNTKITYIGSQCHEGWIDKWTAISPILLEDENYKIPNWFRLDDYGIDYVPEVYLPTGGNDFIVTHGTIARAKSGNSAMASLEMEGTSVCVAHTHRLSQVFRTNSLGTTVGLECGCMCQRIPWYTIKGRRLMMDWQQGFVLANFKGNSFSTQCVPIIRDGKDNPYFYIGRERYHL